MIQLLKRTHWVGERGGMTLFPLFEVEAASARQAVISSRNNVGWGLLALPATLPWARTPTPVPSFPISAASSRWGAARDSFVPPSDSK